MGHLKLPSQRSKKSKESLQNYEISLTETICALLEFPKEQSEKGAGSLFKAVMAGNFLNLGRDLENHESNSSLQNSNDLQDTVK